MIPFLDLSSGPIPETRVIISILCGGWFILAAQRQGRNRWVAALLGVIGAVAFGLVYITVTGVFIEFFPLQFFDVQDYVGERAVFTGLMALSAGLVIAVGALFWSEGPRQELRQPQLRGSRRRFSWGRALFALGALGLLVLLQLPAMQARRSMTGKSGDPVFLILGLGGLIVFAIWQGFQGSQSSDPESASSTAEPDRIGQGDAALENLGVTSSAQPETRDSLRPSSSGWPFGFFGTIVVGSLIYFFLRDQSAGIENQVVLIVSFCLAIVAMYVVVRFMR